MTELLEKTAPSLAVGPSDSFSQCFGDYEAATRIVQQVGLTFQPYGASLKWGLSSLAANFVAGYYATTHPQAEASRPADGEGQTELCASLNYIANELLENAVKFHYNKFFPVSLTLQQTENELLLLVSNSLNPASLPHFQALIEEILSCDPAELFLRHLESGLDSLAETSSGLGLLTIRHDYGARLGWKFDLMPALLGVPRQITVTTLARLSLG